MTRIRLVPLLLAALALPCAVHAAETSLLLQLGSQGGDFERRTVLYDCEDGEPMTVTYVNAAPNFIAIVPTPELSEPLIFAAVTSEAGARYAAGQWIWETKGPDASLHDATLDADAPPVLTCLEANNIP